MDRYHIAGLAVDMEVSGRTKRQAAAYAAACQTTTRYTARLNSQWKGTPYEDRYVTCAGAV